MSLGELTTILRRVARSGAFTDAVAMIGNRKILPMRSDRLLQASVNFENGKHGIGLEENFGDDKDNDAVEG